MDISFFAHARFRLPPCRFAGSGFLMLMVLFPAGRSASAQNHDNVWLRTTLSVPLSADWSTDAEVQHRRQNGIGNHDPLDKNLMYSFRGWIHYKAGEHLKFSLSPFAFFSNYRIIRTDADANAPPTGEFRFSAAVETQTRVLNRLALVNRAAVEYRIFEHDAGEITRVRDKLGLQYQAGKSVAVFGYDELLVNASGVSSAHVFDQNRVGAGCDYRFSPAVKCSLGYMRLTRLPGNSPGYVREDDIYLNLMVTLRKKGQH